ncbi:membrane protein insertion efficiency factor YidD [Lysinibacter sp. HNR]|nr:membrane protein insertion efficiency factor YidD [Lysinibacter sp. HNR]WGD38694.1 membrane protein insertion efficiency factor YidD [Lysinibacter sp. HNR]
MGLLKIYRLCISPLYGDVCRYYPSCSRYSLEVFQSHGVFRGVWMTVWRLLRCNPWSSGGIDDVPEREHKHVSFTRHGFVIARSRRKAQ